MLFKIILVLLTVVVPGIAQNRYTSLFIEGIREMNAACASLTLSAKIQLRLNHQTNVMDACEKHDISPQIVMNTSYISLCNYSSFSCYAITPTYKVYAASDIPWISLRYVFCNNSFAADYLWHDNDLILSTHGSNFYVSNFSGNIPIANCHDGSTVVAGISFCKKETDDLDCDFQMSSPLPKTSTTILPHTVAPNSTTTSTTTTLVSVSIPSTRNTVATTNATTTTMTPSTVSVNIPTTTEDITIHSTSTSTSITPPVTSQTSTRSTITFASSLSTIRSTMTSIVSPIPTSATTSLSSSSTSTTPSNPLSSTSLRTTTTTTPLILTSTTNNFATKSSSQRPTSPSTTPQSTPFVPPQNPYNIDCAHPDTELDAIYCHVEATNYTASNISEIVNNTLNAINITRLSPKEAFAVVGIFRRCSEITELTHRAFTDMSRLVDTMLEAPSESYIKTHEAGIKTTQIILDSVNRVILNSPSDVSYLNGNNVALLGKTLTCENGDVGGGLADTGSGFTGDRGSKARASISIDGSVACNGQGHRVFYTIYRNSKFFIGSDPKQTAKSFFYLNFDADDEIPTTETSKKKSEHCDPSLFGTDDSILSGNVISNNSTGPSKFIHSVAKEGINQNIVTIKFDKKHIGVFLHGKLGIRWWDTIANAWSSESCTVKENDGYYVSKCTHLTDFTLLVDGINTDPILCDKVLEIVNYIVSIGSMFSLLILNVIYIIILCIILSLFQSWKIVKMFVWNSKLERIFHLMTMKKTIYPIAFTFSTLMTILFGIISQGDFFRRNDSFCWIRPDYLIGAVIIPLTILSINAILTIFIMSLRLFPHFTISKLIRTSSTKINKISNKEARERAFVLFLVQFTLGVPWLLQYFTLFEPKATAWHFLFVVVNGSQGIIILISFIYRCYGTYKSYNLQKRLWS